MNPEISEVLEICNSLNDHAEWHIDERGLTAMQASAFFCGVDLWVEVFHYDQGIDMVVSFDLTHTPELAHASIELGHDEDTRRFRIESVGSAFYKCANELLSNPVFVATREAAALAATTPAALPLSGAGRDQDDQRARRRAIRPAPRPQPRPPPETPHR